MKITKFYADWCWPCRTYSPVLEQVCLERKILLETINIEQNREAVEMYWISSIPATVFHFEWKPDVLMSWVMSKDQLEAIIDSF